VSYSLDVHVLLYASNEGSPRHAPAQRFLEGCSKRDEVLYLGWPTIMAYLRIATHPGVFDRPLLPAHAMENVSKLLRLPHVRMLSEGDGFWEKYTAVCSSLPVRGNLVPDAHLAALLLHNGVVRFYTRDRDFLKFDFLDVRDPFAE
jgi:hypothetical protein